MAPAQRFWIDEEVGYPCLILQGPLGTLNGYVAVSKDHPWYGIGYGECPRHCGEEGCDHRPEARIEVQGRLTYAGRGIVEDLHLVIQLALHEEFHWFGFDTAHAGDIVPGLPFLGRFPESTLKDETYVAHECHRLAVQLSALVK